MTFHTLQKIFARFHIKCPFFQISRLRAPPPGERWKKRMCQKLRLGPNSMPTKFRQNIPSFRATLWAETDEFRLPRRCLYSILLRRTTLKKGTTSLRSGVNKLILSYQITFVSSSHIWSIYSIKIKFWHFWEHIRAPLKLPGLVRIQKSIFFWSVCQNLR